jgi:hypothetical protein
VVVSGTLQLVRQRCSEVCAWCRQVCPSGAAAVGHCLCECVFVECEIPDINTHSDCSANQQLHHGKLRFTVARHAESSGPVTGLGNFPEMM